MLDNNLKIAKLWQKYYLQNNYYHQDIHRLVKKIIPPDASILEFSSRGGELLAELPNKNKTASEFDNGLLQLLYSKNKKTRVIDAKKLPSRSKKKYDYILLSHTLSEIDNIQDFIGKIKVLCRDDTKIVVFHFNYLWKPLLDTVEVLGLIMPSQKEPNWLSQSDIDNFFILESFVKVKQGQSFLFPFFVPFVSDLLNRIFSQIPPFSYFCLTRYAVYKPIKEKKDFSVSIIIPARNEAGNMKRIFNKIPSLGTSTEIIFVEGHSRDDTYATIKKEIANYKGPLKASLCKQKGKGKGNAVRLGFSKAHNELLMILDADLTVDPKELPIARYVPRDGIADFVMGSRLVYPMEKLAMRTLNIFGNKFFSIAFSFLLDQRIKDTLCGTKVLFRKDYLMIAKNRKFFGDFDPFGDYDLIFGASRLNLKIVEVPIRYKERTYGKTNISRFRHGLLLLQMVLFAARKLKFN